MPQENYRSLLALATKHRNRKRGKKTFGYWLRLHPECHRTVQIGYWQRGEHTVVVDGKTVHRCFDEADQPFIPIITLAPDHAILGRPTSYQKYPMPIPEALQAKYPTYQPERHGPYTKVDISYNILIEKCGLMVRHDGTRDKHPGFLWRARAPGSYYWQRGDDLNQARLWGPVRYDYATHAFTPLLPQPVKQVKDDVRKAVNTGLRTAFKRLRILARMGVTISDEEYYAVLAPEGDARLQNWQVPLAEQEKAERFRARLEEHCDHEALLALLQNADFEDRRCVVELAVRSACILFQTTWFSGNVYPICQRIRRFAGDTGMVSEENKLASLRKRLHNKFEVVDFTHG